MNFRYAIIVPLFFLTFSLCAQRGTSVFSFSNHSPTARGTALGQYTTALIDGDPGLAFSNPANISKEISWTGALNQGYLSPGIQAGSFYVANRWDSLDVQWMAGATYLDHGDFIRSDVFGQRNGQFQSGGLSIFTGVAKKVYDRLYAGIRLNYLQQTIDEFASRGMSTDLGFLYVLPDQQLSVGLSWRNIGWQWQAFGTEKEYLRSRLDLAFAKRLEHLPFRFSIIYHDLNRWDLTYDSPVQDEDRVQFNDPGAEQSGLTRFSDQLFRHFAINGEFFIGKGENVLLRVAYDHQRRRELRLPNSGSMAGFSLGIGIQVKGIRFDYGWGSYHQAGGLHHLGLQFDFRRWQGKEPIGIL